MTKRKPGRQEIRTAIGMRFAGAEERKKGLNSTYIGLPTGLDESTIAFDHDDQDNEDIGYELIEIPNPNEANIKAAISPTYFTSRYNQEIMECLGVLGGTQNAPQHIVEAFEFTKVTSRALNLRMALIFFILGNIKGVDYMSKFATKVREDMNLFNYTPFLDKFDIRKVGVTTGYQDPSESYVYDKIHKISRFLKQELDQ